MTEEYYLMYFDLYDVANGMVKIINDDLNIILPQYEVCAIILHLHATIHNESVSKVALYTQIIDHSLKFIYKHLDGQLSENSIAKERLITHLKFALKRMEKNQTLENPFMYVIKEKYEKVYNVAKMLSMDLDDKFHITLLEFEVGYIAVHIYSLQCN